MTKVGRAPNGHHSTPDGVGDVLRHRMSLVSQGAALDQPGFQSTHSRQTARISRLQGRTFTDAFRPSRAKLLRHLVTIVRDTPIAFVPQAARRDQHDQRRNGRSGADFSRFGGHPPRNWGKSIVSRRCGSGLV